MLDDAIDSAFGNSIDSDADEMAENFSAWEEAATIINVELTPIIHRAVHNHGKLRRKLYTPALAKWRDVFK